MSTLRTIVVVALFATAPSVANGATWTQNSNGCYTSSSSSAIAAVKALAMAALKQANSTVGCVTYPYLQTPYNYSGLPKAHAGVDLRAKTAKSVYAIAGGTVVATGGTYGKVVIDTGTGKIIYLHLSSIAVSPNQTVTANDYIGKSGKKGVAFHHLHIEVRTDSSSYAVGYSSCSGNCDSASDVAAITDDPSDFVESVVPSGWTCDTSYYNVLDGCDCECGVPDPDCQKSGQQLFNCGNSSGKSCSSAGKCVSSTTSKTWTTLGTNQSHAGSVSKDSKKWYKFTKKSGYKYKVSLNPNGSGDPDLFGSYLSSVSKASGGYQYKSSKGGGSTDSFEFSANSGGTYYLLVFGYSASSYALTVTETSLSSTTSNALAVNTTHYGSVSSTGHKKYTFTRVNGKNYSVVLHPTSGDPDLFTAKYSWITTDTYQCKSAKGSTSDDTCSFTATDSGTNYILVYGYSTSNYTLRINESGGNSSCQYACSTYNFNPGQCYQNWKCSCTSGCLSQGCTSSTSCP